MFDGLSLNSSDKGEVVNPNDGWLKKLIGPAVIRGP